MKRAWTVLSLLCVCLIPHVLAAQEAVNYGTIGGRVSDQQGAFVPGARVSVRHIETNLVRGVVTDTEGRFRFPYLRIGRYEVAVSLPGFEDTTRVVLVAAGSAFELPITLAVAGLDASVTVTGDAILESARSQIAGTIVLEEIATLPMNGRNVLDLALGVPGVSPTNTGSTQLFAETSAVPGQGISVSSQRNFSNNFIVDGLSANDDAAGFASIPYGIEAVDQFQVVTSGGQAELGRAIGGYISVVTRSGTNEARGDLYGYFRDDSLNATNALLRDQGGKKPPMSQQQYGGSIGGPVVRDRTFYFTNVERRRLEQNGLATIAEGDVRAINARLAAVGYRGALVSTGSYPNPVESTHVLGKIDHQIGSRDQLSLRYSLYDVASRNARGAGGLSAPSASSGLDNIDHAFAVSNTLTLSDRTVNETRMQVSRGDLKALPVDPIGPFVNIAGVASFGTLSSSPQARVNTLFQFVTNVSHQAGAHALRAGADFIYNDDTITFPRSSRGAYTFSSLPSFLGGTYNNFGFSQAFGDMSVSQTNPNLGVYAQDEWKVTPSLTVNAGIRYDLQFLETVDTDANNISPRVGAAWTPGESRKTVIRASAGVFFDRVPLRALANALLSAGNTTDLAELRQRVVSVSPNQAAAPAFPHVLAAEVPSGTPINFTTFDRGLDNAEASQIGVEIERQVGDSGTFSVGYQYLRGEKLLMQINQNVPTCPAAGGNNGCRPDPSYANNNRYSSAGESDYHGVHVSLVQRPAPWGHFRISYTLSKSMNNVGENFFSAPIDPTDLSKDWARSDDDQRHRLVVNGSVRLPYAVEASGSLQAYSSLPLNITSGLTTIQGTMARPIVNGAFIGRNAGAGSDFFSVSARVSRTFRMGRHIALEGIAEVFNLTNRTNAIARNGNFGAGAYPSNPSPTFGRVTAAGEPRTVQVAIRVRF